MSEKSQDNDNEEYNDYVRSNGIFAKIDAKTNASVRDWFNTRARKKIRQHGGMLTTEDAVKLVLREDRQELIDDVSKELRKGGLPLLADAYSKEETREHVIRVLQAMLEKMESTTAD